MKTIYWIFFSLLGLLLLVIINDVLNGFLLINNPLVGEAIYSILKLKIINIGFGIVLIISSLIFYNKRKIKIALILLGICLAISFVRIICYL